MRLLALAAVRLALDRGQEGAEPPAPGPVGPEPYSGRQMTLEVGADGGLVLAAGSARDLWRERNPTVPFPGEPPFVWRLPPAP